MAKSKYDPETFPMKVKSWAKEGITEKVMAENLGVSKTTFEDYKNKYPDFLNALKEGKKPLVIEIENALYTSAKGHTGPDGKYYRPNPTSCIFALKNICKDKWRDKQELEHSGGVEVTIVDDIDEADE